MVTSAEAAAAPSRAWRQPVPVLLSIVLVAAVVVRFGVSERALVGAIFVVVLVALAAIDLERRLIPNRIVLPATAVVLALQIAFFPDRTVEWIAAALGAAAFLALPLLVVRGGVGMGDIKLALLIGAALGAAVVDALFYGAVAGAVFAVVLLRRHGDAARRMGFPFGPFLAFGAVVALFAGAHLGP